VTVPLEEAHAQKKKQLPEIEDNMLSGAPSTSI
jgi:hypothetical protein